MQLLASFISWWYGSGWKDGAQNSLGRLRRTADLFSFGLILPTLFAPFRQISAGGVRGPLGDQFRVFLDRTVSRFVGFVVRIVMLIVGCLALIVLSLGCALWLIAWPLIPLTPVALVILAIGGVKL